MKAEKQKVVDFKHRIRSKLEYSLDWLCYKTPKPLGSTARFIGKKFLRILLSLAVLNHPVALRIRGILDLVGRAYRPANNFMVRSFSVSLEHQDVSVEFPIGCLRGYKLPWHKDFTIGFMLNGGIVEKATADAAEHILSKGDIVFDIGANLGYTALHFADLVGPQGKVFAFEPDPELAVRLEKVRDLNSLPQMFVRRKAVSREHGQAQFIIGEESYLGRLADSTEVSTSNRLITVNMTSVDRVVANEGITRVALIKIDVEGGELNVLHGMKETLARHKPVLLIEFHTSELEEHGISFLKDHRYQSELLDRARPPAKHCHYLCRPL